MKPSLRSVSLWRICLNLCTRSHWLTTATLLYFHTYFIIKVIKLNQLHADKSTRKKYISVPPVIKDTRFQHGVVSKVKPPLIWDLHLKPCTARISLLNHARKRFTSETSPGMVSLWNHYQGVLQFKPPTETFCFLNQSPGEDFTFETSP